MVVTAVALASTFAFKSGFEAQARPPRRHHLRSFQALTAAHAPPRPQEELAERDAKVFNAKKRKGTK